MATSPVAPFSGGEKARLVLALIVYHKPNLLLLDEPTNHLDLEMRHALSMALQDFEGAMIVVSHDRHLLRTVTDTLLLVANGKVSPFDGDLDDYRKWVKDQNKETSSNIIDGDLQMTTGNKKQQRQDAAELRRQLQPLRNKVRKLETQIEQLNNTIASLQEQLADSTLYEPHNKHQLKTTLEKKTESDKQLQLIEQQWLETSEELEAIEKGLS
jgi:ATP-binding cassette subfamily F protein 3